MPRLILDENTKELKTKKLLLYLNQRSTMKVTSLLLLSFLSAFYQDVWPSSVSLVNQMKSFLRDYLDKTKVTDWQMINESSLPYATLCTHIYDIIDSRNHWKLPSLGTLVFEAQCCPGSYNPHELLLEPDQLRLIGVFKNGLVEILTVWTLVILTNLFFGPTT